MKSAKEIFSERLGELLDIRGKTQAQLAKEIGITPQAISSYVKGKTTPDYDMLCQIADTLGVTVDYLLGSETTLFCEEEEISDELQEHPDAELLLKHFRRFVVVREKIRTFYRNAPIGTTSDNSLLFQFYGEINRVLTRFNTISEIFGQNDARCPELVGVFDGEDFSDKLVELLQNENFSTCSNSASIVTELIRIEQTNRR